MPGGKFNPLGLSFFHTDADLDLVFLSESM
jgi:hypothetical protein